MNFSYSKLTFLTRNPLFLLETHFFLTRNSLFLLETHFFLNSKLTFLTRNSIYLLELTTQLKVNHGSDSDVEVWSFDRAINEVFRLLPQELCPKTTQEQTPVKPLSGIKHLCDSIFSITPIKDGRKHNKINTK